MNPGQNQRPSGYDRITRVADAGTRFSPERDYRYTLTRLWLEPRPGPRQGELYVPDATESFQPASQWTGKLLVCCMLNPSTADETVLDPTLTRVQNRAQRLGCRGFVALNLFALRATNPREMLAHPEPIGPENDHWLLQVLALAIIEGHPIVAAWGDDGDHRGRCWELARAAAGVPWLCLGTTLSGQPRHPLYVPNVRELRPWVCPGEPPSILDLSPREPGDRP